MSTHVYKPKEARPPEARASDILVPPPIKREEKGKIGAFKIILGLAMAALMIFFMIFMFTSMGRQPNPMMMMTYTMMMVGVLTGIFTMAFQSVGGGDVSLLDSKRQSIDNQLDIANEDVREVAEVQQKAALWHHPNPMNIRRMVDLKDKTYWSGDVTPDVPRDTVRIGIGVERLVAALKTATGEYGNDEDTGLHEQQEVYSAKMTSQFISVHSSVPEVPVARTLNAKAYGFRGPDQNRINGLIRSMILSGTYKYSPHMFMVGAITRNTADWGWLKWLPHSKNRLTTPGRGGYKQLSWRTYEEFLDQFEPHLEALAQSGARLYVIVDDPDLTMHLPGKYADGIPNVTFLAANVYDDAAVTSRPQRFHVDKSRLTLYRQKAPLRADFVSVFDAELTARAMARSRPEGFDFLSSVIRGDTEEEDDKKAVSVDLENLPTILDYLKIPNLDDFDLKTEIWDKNEYTKTLISMFGYVVNDHKQPTGEIAELNIFQHVSGGTGPHGMLSGGTGTGKSFMMTALVLGLLLSYSPSKLNFIFMDFKGGPTWKPFRGVKHGLATITNLENSVDMLERAEAAIGGELQRRQQMIDNHENVEDINDYRAKQRVTPGMEPMPYLFIVADETHEFLTGNPQYRKIFEQIGRIGRSIGVHLLLASQYLDEAAVGSFSKNVHYGISLRVIKESESATVLHGNRMAVKLPANRIAMFWRTHLQDDHYSLVTAFNWGEPYMRPVGPELEDEPEAQRVRPPEILSDDVTGFDLFHAPAGPVIHEDGEEAPAPVPTRRRAGAYEDSGKTILTAAVELVIRHGQSYHPHQPWQEPLSYPLSFYHFKGEYSRFNSTDGIEIRIGDTDIPAKHVRVPFTVRVDSSSSYVGIYGGPGVGTTNTIRAMIASSARTFHASEVSWYLYDHRGAGMHAMRTWPNVGGYTSRTDEDGVLRMRGEMDRIIRVRERAMAEHKLRTIDEYFARRAELGVTGDPYGRVFFAVDGLDAIIEDAGDFYTTERDWWYMFMSRAGQYGVHTVYTARQMAGRIGKIADATPVKVFHSVREPVDNSSEVRAGIKAIPSTQKGSSIYTGSVDSNNVVQVYKSRVIVPIDERIMPDGESEGVPIFNLKDYTEQITALGEAERSTKGPEDLAVVIREVPQLVPYSVLSGAYQGTRWQEIPAGSRPLPVALNRATFDPVAVDLKDTPHVLVAGTDASGVSTTLRTLINSITTAYTPEEAGLIIIDGRMGLVDMMDSLIARGYLNANNYLIGSDERIPDIVNKIAFEMDRRKPKDMSKITAPMMRDRTYITGKEMFVIIDGMDAIRSRQAGMAAAGTLEWLGTRIPSLNVGVHFFVGAEAANLPNWVGMNKFTSALTNEHKTRVMMLRGRHSDGPLISGTKLRFKEFQQKGRAIWWANGESLDQVVQIGMSEPLM